VGDPKNLSVFQFFPKVKTQKLMKDTLSLRKERALYGDVYILYNPQAQYADILA
jgi:hypothetical protein